MVADFELRDYSELGTSDVIKLALQADTVRRRVEGYLTGLLGRLGELEGEDAMVAVCQQFGLKARKARRQAKVASGLRALPDVLGAVENGYITMDHAEMIAASHARAPLSDGEQADLVIQGMRQDCDQFKNTLATREDQRASVDGLSRTERQRARRLAKVFDGDDDMVIVHAELDAIAGQRVKTAMAAMNTRLLHHDTRNGNDRSHEQRNADALVALMTQRPSTSQNGTEKDEGTAGDISVGGAGEPVPQKTVLVVTADYDAITGELTRAGLIDGTPIELEELRRLACDADIVPAIFDADAQPLYLGRTQRAPNQAQKLALYRRDHHCTQCGLAAQACDIHHVQPWEHGGPTNIDNLVLLCPTCHRKAHRVGHNPGASGSGTSPPPGKPPPPHAGAHHRAA